MINLSVMLGMIGIWQILIIIVVAFLVFGVRWIPKLSQNIKKRIKEVIDEEKNKE